MPKGWTGKRLRIDLTLRRAWSEDISEGDLRQWLGGRGINASFFHQNFPSPASSPENPIAFAAGPLTGTLAPCSGWISIASFSPFSDPPRYAFTRMAGHFGVPLKGAGFDQCILQGKANRPLYLWIDNGKVKFEEAGHLWGKGTTDTTVAIQEEKGDRSIEVLCIGPAGEKQLPFANVIHRLSWTGDHLGLGYLFGVKNLKAIAIRGKKPVTLHDPQRFLNLCLKLKDRIQKDLKLEALKERGTFSPSVQPSPRSEQQWTASLSTYLSGQESCFSCPVHCGRNIQHEENYTGGINLEKAWHLGPRIGVFDGEWTLKLHHLCQIQGLDPFLTGSLLARILDGAEALPLSDEDPRQTDHIWEQGEKAFVILSRIINNGKNGFQFTLPPCSENEDLDVLAGIIPFCTIVVNRLNRVTVSNMIDLIDAATGHALSIEDLRGAIRNILRMESRLRNEEFFLGDQSSFPRAGEGQIDEILKMEGHSNESTVHRIIS
ncbi:MAG: aldehyde ferredoxin oxidoreductase N-terminal domain-containing protein [Thermodesulfobacteriota bacterium]